MLATINAVYLGTHVVNRSPKKHLAAFTFENQSSPKNFLSKKNPKNIVRSFQRISFHEYSLMDGNTLKLATTTNFLGSFSTTNPFVGFTFGNEISHATYLKYA